MEKQSLSQRADAITAISRTMERTNGLDGILKVAGRDREATEICYKLSMFYTRIDPSTNPEWHKFFDDFTGRLVQDRSKHAESWYKDREPLKLLEQHGIKEGDIVILYDACGRDIRQTYYALALNTARDVVDHAIQLKKSEEAVKRKAEADAYYLKDLRRGVLINGSLAAVYGVSTLVIGLIGLVGDYSAFMTGITDSKSAIAAGMAAITTMFTVYTGFNTHKFVRRAQSEAKEMKELSRDISNAQT